MTGAPTSRSGEILDLGGLALGRALREGDVSCAEVTAAALDRLDAVEPHVSAFASVFRRKALRQAQLLDRRRRAEGPDPLPSFWGVPIGIKDLDAVAGSFLRAGSRAYRWVYTPFDGAAVRRVRAGGFVLVGKTTTSELAIMPVTEPDLHPPTRNPWDLSRTAGGSSGGAGAAVAAGVLPLAHASDGAGSIRIPASFCHLFGFKPSRGAVPNFYAAQDFLGLSVTGCVSHRVDDAAAMLDVLRGVPDPHRRRDSWLHDHQAAPAPLRVRLALASPLVEVAPAVRAATEQMGATLEELGHRVEVGPDLAVGEISEFFPIMARMVAEAPVLSRRDLQPITAWMHRAGRRVRKADARAAAADLGGRVQAWFGAADLVVTPTVGLPPPPVGAFADRPPEEAFADAARLGAFTAPFNASGQPAASIPAGLDPAGLPIGVQIVGQPGQDLTVLQVARQLEEAIPWAGRRAPPLPGRGR